MASQITAEQAQALLDYNPATGELTWKPRVGLPMFNARCAGKTALACLNSAGYRHGSLMGEDHLAHRVIWLITHGRWPIGIDHDDGNSTNNCLRNLVEKSQAGNMRNRKLANGNTSGVFGVSQIYNGKWRARIKVLGVMHSLGHYATRDEAVTARRAAEARFNFHPNHGKR